MSVSKSRVPTLKFKLLHVFKGGTLIHVLKTSISEHAKRQSKNLAFWSQRQWTTAHSVHKYICLDFFYFFGELGIEILACFQGKVSISWHVWWRVGRLFLTIWDHSSIWRFIYIYLSKYLSYVTLYMVLDCAPVAEC